MKEKKLFLLPLIILMLNACNNRSPDIESSKPNIVVILADDFGVGDIQAHYPDNKIRTPHLDEFVTQGMSFTDAHSGSAVCSPTRYGLLTGRYSWRTPLQEWVVATYEPPLIEENRLTLPDYLSQQDYQTACIGKWHLGWNWPGEQSSRRLKDFRSLRDVEWDFTQAIAGGPTDRGFDYFYGVDLPNSPPFTFIENDRVVVQPTAKYIYDPNEGVVMPKGFAGSPMAPGWRFDQILPEITSRAVDYIHKQSKSDSPFFLYFSMTSPHEPVVPSKDFAGKSGISPIADFVMETDWSAGQIIKAIDDAGISDNTIVIFTADNGHSHYTGWESLVEAGHLPSGPYRGHKGDIWEGGHRVPLIVRWPGKVAAGGSNNQLVCLNDIFATCSEIVSGDLLPDNAAEDSFSFLNTLLGKDSPVSRTNLVSHSVHGEFAYRSGPWKIVFKLPGSNRNTSRGKAAVVELYNLDEDIAEENNLTEERPEMVSQLTDEMRSLVQRGTSRPGPDQLNDVNVRFDTIQEERWAPAAAQDPIDIEYGEIEMVHSDAMQKDLPVLIFLPESYNQTTESFPVVYFLHGVNNQPVNETGLRNLFGPKLELTKLAETHQSIIVTPIVGNTYYLDAPEKSENRFATYTGKELPLFIDEHYRTIASREGRFLAGFSMGGYGAISLLCRYSNDFSIAASRGGALDLAFGIHDLDWDGVGENKDELLGGYWTHQENYHLNSCFNLINHIRNRKDIGVIIEVGRDDFLYKTNSRFEKRLKELDVPHIYSEYPGGHHFDRDVMSSLLNHIDYYRGILSNSKNAK